MSKDMNILDSTFVPINLATISPEKIKEQFKKREDKREEMERMEKKEKKKEKQPLFPDIRDQQNSVNAQITIHIRK